MTEPEPIEHLLSLAEAASAGRPAPEPAAAWLAAGLALWLEGTPDQPLSLEKALGLVGERGTRSARWRLLTMQRDGHLRRAWGLVTPEVVSGWRRSQLLAEEVATFESRFWPRYRLGDEPPPGRLSALRQELLGAFRLQARISPAGVLGRDAEFSTGIPLTAEGLHRLMKAGAPSSFVLADKK